MDVIIDFLLKFLPLEYLTILKLNLYFNIVFNDPSSFIWII